MKRVMAVSWEMPPMYGPRGAQVSATLSELAARGWSPTVMCLAPRRGGPHWPDGEAAETPIGVELVRIPSPEESLAYRLVARLFPVVRRFPDEKRFWIKRVSDAIDQAVAVRSFSGLITFAQPWSDHLIGLRIHRTHALPWVAHFSDPWVDSPYLRGPTWQRRIWQRMERSVVAEADALIFVTDETGDLVMRKYPREWRRKVTVVPHGYDPRRASPAPLRRTGPMRVVYTGRFYTGARTPLAFLDALAAIHRRESLAGTLEVVFVGPHVEEFRRDANRLGLDGVVRFEGRQRKADAARVAADADVLLVIDSPTNGQSVFLPSKLVDYLAFRKPILGLTPLAGASARLLARLDCPIAAPDDPGAIGAAIASLIDRWRAGRLQVSSSFEATAAEFDIRTTTAHLDNVLSRTFNRT
jgi:glycosyltransferase involved in cell wall biosynthesis